MRPGTDAGAGIFNDVSRGTAGTDPRDDRKDQVLGCRVVTKVSIDRDAHGAWHGLPERLRHHHVHHLRRSDAERQGPKRAVGGGMRVAPADHHAMVGYTLKNVLSEHGSVSRGVAEERDADGYLKRLSELTKIVVEKGKIISREETGDRELSGELPVSMNCWGFQAGIFELSEKMFADFVKNNVNNPSAEFYIALMVSELIRQKLGKVNIIGGGTTWFGVTYKEDKEEVSGKIRALVDAGEYPKALWK